MSRDYHVNGESLMFVKGPAGSTIANLQQLALTEDPIRVRPQFFHKDITVDAWGMAPPEIQWMLGTLDISCTLIHFDRDILRECTRLSMGGGGAEGQFARAGTRMGNNQPRFGPSNNFISLNIASPIDNLPWRFFFTYMTGPPWDWPLGTEKSRIQVNFRVVPYTVDPANIQGGVILGATNYPLWDRTLDT